MVDVNIDEKSLNNLSKGDHKAFIWFYDKYVSSIFRFIYLKISSTGEAEDLTSEAFLKMWKSIKEKKQVINNPRALIYQIARNLVIDFYRKKSKSDLLVDFAGAKWDLPEKNDDLSQKVEFNLDLDKVKNAIKELKDDYQDAIIWHYLEDMPIQEIAQILDKSEGAVRVLVSRALTALKKEMGEGS